MEDSVFYSELTKNKSFLKGYAITLTKDLSRSEDLYQDTLLKALLYKDKYIDNSNFKGWVGTILRNTFISNYRKSDKISNVVNDTKNALDIAENTWVTFIPVESNLCKNDILRIVDSLPAFHKKLIRLRIEGCSYLDLQKEMQIPLGSVKKGIYDARKKLNIQLKQIK
jgi:RNA polymerase sigma-70 factor (ECF subfamily)